MLHCRTVSLSFVHPSRYTRDFVKHPRAGNKIDINEFHKFVFFHWQIDFCEYGVMLIKFGVLLLSYD